MKHWLLFLCLAFASVCTRAADTMPPEMLQPPAFFTTADMQQLPAHPRLLLNAAQEARLRELIRTEPRHRALFDRLRQKADEALRLPPVDYRPPYAGANALAAIRQAEYRIFTLALAARLTGEAAYVEGARGVMHGLAQAQWPRSHFLDVATGSLALGIGLDWLYDRLTPAERSKFVHKIAQDALDLTTSNLPSLSFLWGHINWNQICNAGLAIGALAIAESDPERSAYVVNRAIAMVPRAAGAYAPDGLYAEGPSYWAYGTAYQVLLIEALRSALGASQGLEKSPGFLASARVVDLLTGPSGKLFNYFDNRAERAAQSLSFWFARETGDADLAEGELQRMQRPASGNLSINQPLPLALLWLAPDAPGASRPVLPLLWKSDGPQPVAVLRSAWGDPQATWLAVKGGRADDSHGHMDAGAFVLEAQGVRWAIDPEYEPYLQARQRVGLTHHQFFSYAPDSARWKFFLWGAEGHNILRFDGANPRVDGHAAFGAIQQTPAGASVTVDLDATYAGQAGQVRRSFTLRPDGAVALFDAWLAPARGTELSWQWLTQARVVREPGGVRLEQEGKLLRLEITSPAPHAVQIQPAQDLARPPYDVLPTGLTRIVVRTRTPPGAPGWLRVIARPVSR